MNTNSILAELRAERDRIDLAIAAIGHLTSTGRKSTGRPKQAVATRRRRGRRLSAAARAKLSRLMKQRWAAGKMGKKANAKAQTSKHARRISAAGRKRIAEATKRRWAEWRRMQKKPVAKAA